MPVGKYFQGHGEEVMGDMTARYGAKKGKSVFYATANKRGQNPPKKKKRPAHEGFLKGAGLK